MINVLYITVGVGGSDVALINLLKSIDREQINPLVITSGYIKKGLKQKLNHLGILCFELKYDVDCWPHFFCNYDRARFFYYLFRRIVINYITKIRIKNIAKSFNADIIHTNSSVFQIGYKVALELKIPHVWHLRELQGNNFKVSPHPIFGMKSLLRKLNYTNNFNIAITRNVFDYYKLSEKRQNSLNYNKLQ